MRTVIQRVTEASVSVPAEGYESRIGKGLLVLAAFIDEDTDEDLDNIEKIPITRMALCTKAAVAPKAHCQRRKRIAM